MKSGNSRNLFFLLWLGLRFLELLPVKMESLINFLFLWGLIFGDENENEMIFWVQYFLVAYTLSVCLCVCES